MLADLVSAFVRANGFAGLAILLVLAIRIPARRFLGAQAAYALWLAAPLAFLASFVPGSEAPSAAEAAAPLTAALPAALPLAVLAMVWLGGVALAASLVVLGQLRFLARARSGLAGPAVVGVISPRLVTPANLRDTFTDAECALIRAHERAHIDRNDPRTNALIATAQVLCWFNPLVHLAAWYARLDQELACDATVMATRSRDRKLYAQTMLKTQLAAGPALPLGCHWLAGAHPLETRIGHLKYPAVAPARQTAGAAAALTLALGAAYLAWASQPPTPPRAHFVQSIYTLPDTQPAAVMISMTREQIAALPQPRNR